MDGGALLAADPLTQWLSDLGSSVQQLEGFSSQLWACCVTYIESHTPPPVVVRNKTLHEMNACVCSCVLAQKVEHEPTRFYALKMPSRLILCKLGHQNQPSYREKHLSQCKTWLIWWCKCHKMHFPRHWLLPSVKRKLQLRRCVRFLGFFSVWIISVITAIGTTIVSSK